jgi:hypothetical protein
MYEATVMTAIKKLKEGVEEEMDTEVTQPLAATEEKQGCTVS